MRILLLFSSFLFYQITHSQNYNPCVQSIPLHIVVLGSSTAAGSGPSSSDSAWVNRYRKHILSINPQNQVTNLAVGGTTTYNIMPDWYVPATGKPNRNTAQNISEAIRLGADAIIVNMPSNDAASGFPATEQMNNFRLLKAVADSANIKFWVCTTQPRIFNTAGIQIQLETRDSITAYFGNYAIDFWSSFADTTNQIDSLFDSGDGVHMNDTAHGILSSRVILELIPNELADTLSYTDIQIQDLIYDPSICGDSLDLFSVIVMNMGQNYTSPISITFEVTDQVNLTTTSFSQTIQTGLNGCSSDTFLFYINSHLGGTYTLNTYLDSVDINTNNDSLTLINLNRKGFPNITAADYYYCKNDSVFLTASTITGDTILWYDSLNATTPIKIGSSYSFAPNGPNTEVFVQSVSGPLHFQETFDLTRNANVNWNGYMFDIVPSDSLTLDSISVPINTLGNQKIVAYFRYGSHLGFESSSSNWSYWGIDSTTILNPGDFAQLNYSALQLTPNDTLAIYLHLQNSTSTLSYQRATVSSSLSDPKMEINSGTGIGHTFGATFYPRNFSGKIHYHHGFNPNGDCQSPRLKVSAVENQPYLFLGNDTMLISSDSLSLNVPNSFSNPTWNNGDTSHQIIVSKNTYGLGSHLISVSAFDSLGCINIDTILIQINTAVGLETSNNSALIVSPNPSNGLVYFNGEVREQSIIQVFDQYGRLIKETIPTNKRVDLRDLSKGLYHILLVEPNQQRKKVTLLIQ